MLRMFLQQNFTMYKMAISEFEKRGHLTFKFEFLSSQVTGSDLDPRPTTFWPRATLFSLPRRAKRIFCFLSSANRKKVISKTKISKTNFKMPMIPAKIKIFAKFQRWCESFGRVYLAHQNLVLIRRPLPTRILPIEGNREIMAFLKT